MAASPSASKEIVEGSTPLTGRPLLVTSKRVSVAMGLLGAPTMAWPGLCTGSRMFSAGVTQVALTS